VSKSTGLGIDHRMRHSWSLTTTPSKFKLLCRSEEAAKAKGWTEKPSKKGEGKRFSDASGNNGIRIMKRGGNRGGPDGPMKSGGDYAQIVGGRDAGKYVPLAGNGTLGR
jgi:hypothetical protein